ncbi:MAG: hypothetical protein M3Z65_00650 [Chloroflexota bacterium]|nr:hypothetical protein [Chloroflexota bacterium]
MSDTCAAHFITEIDALIRRGVDLKLVNIGAQGYALVRGVPSPVPPWDRAAHDILISLPLADSAALDGFYLELPYGYNQAAHPRVSGQMISYDDRQWQLVSWHYLDGQPWTPGHDDLDTHIEHCRGFFIERAARG